MWVARIRRLTKSKLSVTGLSPVLTLCSRRCRTRNQVQLLRGCAFGTWQEINSDIIKWFKLHSFFGSRRFDTWEFSSVYRGIFLLSFSLSLNLSSQLFYSSVHFRHVVIGFF